MTQELAFTPDSYLDRLPPQNIEAEEAILGGILLDPEAIARVCDRLTPQVFYVQTHQEIYAAAVKLHKSGYPTDLISMANRLEQDGKFVKQIGVRQHLRTLTENTVSAVNIDALVELIIEKHIRRQLIKVSQEIMNLAYSGEELKTVLDQSQQKVFNLAQYSVDDRPELIHASDAALSLYEQLEARLEGKIKPISSGFYDLDAMTGGFEPGQLILLGGRPAMGKSAMGMSIGWEIAHRQQKPVFLFSLEMTKEQLVQRLASQLLKIELGYFKSARLTDEQWRRYCELVNFLQEQSKLYFCDRFDIDLNNIKSSMRRAIARTGEKPGLVIIDHVSLLAGTEEGAADERIKMKRTTRALKQLAGNNEFNCPVLALSQLSRGVENRQNKRPMLADLRESGSLEEDADFVMFVYRDEYYNPDTPDRGLAEVILAKGRDSATGTIKLLFDGQFTEFKNLARNQY
jgi:replicative DNA helicase